jgi:hypothetical protein
MAAKKARSVRAGARQPGKAAARPVRQSAAAPAPGGDPNRLLREAAWSQMFGRVEAKNPFTR